VLKNYIRQNLKLGPKAIKANLYAERQIFSLKVIQEKKKEILDELFPKDRKIAFHPTNCLTKGSQDNFEDNLFKLQLSFPITVKKKNNAKELLENNECVIFATRSMLYQMHQAKQYFIDGTFSVSPTGFQQMIVIMVLLPSINLFYPSC